jgi:HK97 family phage major capsid protein
LVTKLVKISRKLLRSSPIDLESWIAQRLAYKFAVTEEKAFLTGTGAQQPLGVFVANVNGIPTTRDTTCASQTVFTADEVIDVRYSIADQYARNATWIAHRDWVKRCRKLKDSQNQYLWAAGLSGAPDTILDRPLIVSEFAPNTFTAGKYIAVFGDFKTGYMIGDALSFEVQNISELFTLKNQVGLLGRKETDGMPVVAAAFGRMILAP